jgi:predicted  nucleic acid-binding Zn-ribbon protein
MNPFEMVVLIVAIVVIGRIVSDRYRNRRQPGAAPAEANENARLKSEIQQLKDRIATLERLAVDTRQRLADEIDALGRD